MQFIRKMCCGVGACALGLFATPAQAEDTFDSISIAFHGHSDGVVIQIPDGWIDIDDDEAVPESDVTLVDKTGQKMCNIFIGDNDDEPLDFANMTELAQEIEECVFPGTAYHCIETQYQQENNFLYRKLKLSDSDDTSVCSVVYLAGGDYLVGAVFQEPAIDDEQFVDDCNFLLQQIFYLSNLSDF